MPDASSKRSLWRDFRRSPMALVSSALIAALALGAIFAPWLAPQNPYNLETLNLLDSNRPPIWLPKGKMPYLLGTDNQGRDILSTILFGLRISFLVAIGVVTSAGVLGTAIGLWTGFRGGWPDALLMRIADIVFSFSTTLMAILIMGVFQARGIVPVIFAIAITDWVRYARTARGSTMSVSTQEFVQSAIALGLGTPRILVRHILPNVLPPLLIIAAVDFAVVIILESTLSFLGIGVPVSQPSLGMMISNGSEFLYAGRWWMIVFPGLTLVVLTMAVNVFGDWLRDALNPHART